MARSIPWMVTTLSWSPAMIRATGGWRSESYRAAGVHGDEFAVVEATYRGVRVDASASVADTRRAVDHCESQSGPAVLLVTPDGASVRLHGRDRLVCLRRIRGRGVQNRTVSGHDGYRSRAAEGRSLSSVAWPAQASVRGTPITSEYARL